MNEIFETSVFHLTSEQRQFIETLFREMHPMLLRFARAGLGSDELAEEAVQEVFLRACAAPEKVVEHEKPKGWTVKTLKNVLKEMYRKRDRMRELIATNSEFRNAVHCDDYFLIEYADILSPEEFELICKLKVDHYTVREAAEELGISVEACKKRSQRAMEKLRKKFGMF